jgi:hypothetical protein
MKKVILHIGTEKTATKSLQQFFSLNYIQFKKAGIWYPCSTRLEYCHGNAHFPLPASLFHDCPDFVPHYKHFNPDSLFSKLVRDFRSRDEQTALISSEHFSSRCSQIEEIKKIFHYLEGFDVRIVVYIRPQQELLISAYSTYLKNGGKEALHEIVREKCLTAGISYFNYRLMMKPWWDVFGKNRITVRVFQKKRLKNENVFDDVLSVLDITPTFSFNFPEKLNTAISKETGEFLHFANQYFPEFDDGDRPGWELGQNFRTEVIPLFPKGRPLSQLLSSELLEEVRDFYADDNRELAFQLRPDLNGLLFHEERRTEKTGGCKASRSFSHEFVKWVIDQWKTAHP